MTHELKQIFNAFLEKKGSEKAVLASVVDLEGSSYRRPGVRMLLWENGTMVGAVSGGCVEKEIQRQAAQVFLDGAPKMMSYDGRYRLGCEGLIFILLEPFQPDAKAVEAFTQIIENRIDFELISYYDSLEDPGANMGTVLQLKEDTYVLTESLEKTTGTKSYRQSFSPCFRMVIFGGEHDAVTLCEITSKMGWEVHVLTHPTDDKTQDHFPGAASFHALLPEEIPSVGIDDQTAVVLMTHSFSRDLGYLLALKSVSSAYLGVLGPKKRREKLLDALIEQDPEVDSEFLDGIYGPAGLDLGAETSQEIAISILSEILAVIRNQTVMSLRDKKGTIHSS